MSWPIIFRTLAIFAVLTLSQLAAAQTHLGNLSANPYDPDSNAVLYGAGSPYGCCGNPDRLDSPNSLCGKGWKIISDDD